MNQIVMQKYALIQGILNTVDSLVQEEIGLRVGFEMAKQRPQLQDRVIQDTANKEVALKQKQAEILQFEIIVEGLTSKTTEELRNIRDELNVLIGRRSEIQSEVTNRMVLTPALFEALEGADDEESGKLREQANNATAELPRFVKHVEVLDKRINALVDSVTYGENRIQVVKSLVG